eukprot:3850748-Amphidinium_carterae.1
MASSSAQPAQTIEDVQEVIHVLVKNGIPSRLSNIVECLSFEQRNEVTRPSQRLGFTMFLCRA